MKCYGITSKYRFCLRDGKPLFCPEHAPQPWIAIISAVLGFLISVGASLLASHIVVSSTETVLNSSDFDVEITSMRHFRHGITGFEPDSLLHVPVVIGPILKDSTLSIEERGTYALPSQRNPWKTWHYPSKRLKVAFHDRVTLESLMGKQITAKIPLRALHPKSKNILKIWVKGRMLKVIPDAGGNVVHTMSKSDLGIEG